MNSKALYRKSSDKQEISSRSQSGAWEREEFSIFTSHFSISPMLTHKTSYRVIYGDTDKMGVVYHANYLRWFEMGRAEMFRSLGLTYKAIEEKGIFLPVSEVHCKYIASAQYDDMLIIETTIDSTVRAGMKFDYRILRQSDEKLLVTGCTKHACMNAEGRVVRPPEFLKEIISFSTRSHAGVLKPEENPPL